MAMSNTTILENIDSKALFKKLLPHIDPVIKIHIRGLAIALVKEGVIKRDSKDVLGKYEKDD